MRIGHILILGGSGTLGRACVKKIIADCADVQKITIISRDEVKQLDMMEEFAEDPTSPMEYLLGDVRDAERMKQVIAGADCVIHAAAIKHVVMAEKNPGECWKTNVDGTRNVIEACISNRVRKAVLISTDKAENPIGVYGKSKLEAEQLFYGANGKGTSFGAVRLGNIIGARGSVFEMFARQKKQGALKVTHPEATRFCISKEDAADFVINSFSRSNDKILVPEMRAFKVLDLAKKIAPECRIEITGLRPGDKLHEELRSIFSFQVRFID